jgi:hypothetical protein
MNYIIFFYFCAFFVNSINSINSINFNRTPLFLKKTSIYFFLNDAVKNDLKDPVIYNGELSPFRKDFCKIISEINNIPFKEYTLDKFMYDMPHINNMNCMLYINDFLIGNGRIFNHYEKDILLNINKNSNLILLHSDNIEKIPIKDNDFTRRFPIIQFPKINKKDIIQYIYDTITFNKYDTDLYNLNWIKYNIESLDFEKINILLFELDSMFKNNISFNIIHNNINIIIDSLYNIY